jgi:branched-subunit amino acid ABC-type transport system permease component
MLLYAFVYFCMIVCVFLCFCMLLCAFVYRWVGRLGVTIPLSTLCKSCMLRGFVPIAIGSSGLTDMCKHVYVLTCMHIDVRSVG